MPWVRGIILAGFAVVLLLPASVAASVGAPSGFRLRASNGFTMRVISSTAHAGNPGSVIALLTRHGETVLYETSAGVGEDSIEADLGAVGRIDVHFVPDGSIERQGIACAKRKIEFDGGSYVGTIELRGEEGYTEVHATRARGDIILALSFACIKPVDEGLGGDSPGARLTAHRGFQGGHLELDARINSRKRPSRFEASIAETHGQLRVIRAVSEVGPPGAFIFDVPAGQATLAPPLPFAGAGRFDRGDSGPGRLIGSLATTRRTRSGKQLASRRGLRRSPGRSRSRRPRRSARAERAADVRRHRLHARRQHVLRGDRRGPDGPPG